MNWYKPTIRDVNVANGAESTDGSCHLPALLVVREQYHVTRIDTSIAGTKELVADLRVQNFEKCGYCIQLERSSEINDALKEFAREPFRKTEAEVMSTRSTEAIARVSPCRQQTLGVRGKLR